MALTTIIDNFTPTKMIHTGNFRADFGGNMEKPYCLFTPLPDRFESCPKGYTKRVMSIDQPSVRDKSKYYLTIRVSQQGELTWLVDLIGSAICGGTAGNSFHGCTELLTPKSGIASALNYAPYADITPPTGLVSSATIKAYTKLRNNKIDLADFIGEFAETAGMLTSAVKTGSSMIVAFAKRDYREVARLAFGVHRKANHLRSSTYKRIMSKYPKSVRSKGLEAIKRAKRGKLNVSNPADAYFLMNFGILPLVSIIQDSQIETLGQTRVLTFTVRGSAFEERPIADLSGGTYSMSGTERVKVQVTLKAAISLPELAALSELGISTPFDVLRALYAATPMSWLVDYFYNVGDWLNSLSAPIGLTFMDGCVSTRYSSTYKCARVGTSSGWQIIKPRTSASNSVDAFKRIPLYSFPFPGAIPRNANLLRPDQLLNMGMLALQRLRK